MGVALFKIKLDYDRYKKMNFEEIFKDKLWAVRYDSEDQNVLYKLFKDWNDVVWLKDFFEKNIDDLSAYFKITNLNQAIYNTIEDAEKLECLICDINENSNLDELFRHLEPQRTKDVLIEKEKAKGKYTNRHASWLRIYAIKLTHGFYIITGGAIKLTRTMQERAHTLEELRKMEEVRNFLLANNIIDDLALEDYLKELNIS